jgi:catechol 2,3-dioxygenase-like lactoylglutathione lyase family enzyme
MKTQELHRGRLIDHVQLVVKDLSASKTFYGAIFDVLGIPMGGYGARLLLGRRVVYLNAGESSRAR